MHLIAKSYPREGLNRGAVFELWSGKAANYPHEAQKNVDGSRLACELCPCRGRVVSPRNYFKVRTYSATARFSFAI